eukprot:SAG31_NODE_30_length_32545_cov_9.378999_35_plen_215_part_00
MRDALHVTPRSLQVRYLNISQYISRDLKISQNISGSKIQWGATVMASTFGPTPTGPWLQLQRQLHEAAQWRAGTDAPSALGSKISQNISPSAALLVAPTDRTGYDALNRIKALNSAAAGDQRPRPFTVCCGGRLLLSAAARRAPLVCSVVLILIIGLFLWAEGTRLPGPRIVLGEAGQTAVHLIDPRGVAPSELAHQVVRTVTFSRFSLWDFSC